MYFGFYHESPLRLYATPPSRFEVSTAAKYKLRELSDKHFFTDLMNEIHVSNTGRPWPKRGPRFYESEVFELSMWIGVPLVVGAAIWKFLSGMQFEGDASPEVRSVEPLQEESP
jgi:hypothetical protein